MSARSEKQDELRYEKAQHLVSATVASAVEGIVDPRKARERALEALEALRAQKTIELERASKRFKYSQIAEFALAALVIVQVIILAMRGEPYIWPLVVSTSVCVVLYVVAAILDSKAKATRQDRHFEILATKKIRIKTAKDGVSTEVDFKSM